ncbi:7094_t:CDS:2, partial [Racocetra persica]
ESQTHFHLFEMLCDDVDTLLYNDLLINDIVDLGSPQFSLNEEEQNILIGERSSIKSDYTRWVEQEYERDDLLLKIKLNIFRQVSNVSESSLVEAIVHLIKASLRRLPLEYDINVVRGEKQSIASKNQKVLEESGSRGEHL